MAPYCLSCLKGLVNGLLFPEMRGRQSWPGIISQNAETFPAIDRYDPAIRVCTYRPATWPESQLLAGDTRPRVKVRKHCPAILLSCSHLDVSVECCPGMTLKIIHGSVIHIKGKTW